LSQFLLHLPMLLAMGMAGTLHCAGMCGGLAVLAGGVRRPGRFLVYLAGKASAYVFLGALAGALGNAVLQSAPAAWGARVLAVAAALVLIMAGLQEAGIRLGGRSAPWWSAPRGLAWLAKAGPGGTLLLGAANGLLPCPMVYAFAAMAAMMASPVWGAAVMLLLAVIRAVPLALCSVLAGRFTRFRILPALLMLVMAAITLYRGLSPTGSPHHH
jgi:uncharacterized protein